MRIVPIAGLLTTAFLLSSMPCSAQSLQELAAREKERRSKAKTAGKVYTESDLGKGSASAPASDAATSSSAEAKTTAAEDAAKPAGDAAKKEKTDDELKAEREKAWRDKLAQANAEIAKLQARADDLQRALNDLSQNLYGSTRAAQASELEQIQQKLTGSRKSLEDLQEEGRRSGYR